MFSSWFHIWFYICFLRGFIYGLYMYDCCNFVGKIKEKKDKTKIGTFFFNDNNCQIRYTQEKPSSLFNLEIKFKIKMSLRSQVTLQTSV